jgi:CheY-like chemotaxis protein
MRLWSTAQTVIPKDPDAMKRLLEKTAMFLHRVEANLPQSAKKVMEGPREDADLAGKKVLIVDDDLRNLFALISMLERWQMQVFRAENGQQALEILQQTPDMELVLMDIMMPDMDGYETIQAIRDQEAFGALPIIAVTARAMRSDRQKCLQAGASDYIAKPVSADELLAMLRAWLFRKEQTTHELQERR